VGAGLSACTTGPTPSAPAPAASTGPAGGDSAAGGGTPAPEIVPTASTLHWSKCGGSLSGSECASLAVPRNYADPGGRKITLALSMIPATAPAARQQGVL